jgi:hypothetical protein
LLKNFDSRDFIGISIDAMSKVLKEKKKKKKTLGYKDFGMLTQ